MALIKGANGTFQEINYENYCNSGYVMSFPQRPKRIFYNGKSRGWQDAFVEVLFSNIQKNKHKWEKAEKYIGLYLDIDRYLTGIKKGNWLDNAIRVDLDESFEDFKERVFDWLDDNATVKEEQIEINDDDDEGCYWA